MDIFNEMRMEYFKSLFRKIDSEIKVLSNHDKEQTYDKVKNHLRKDEYGLYVNADNYKESRKRIEEAKVFNDLIFKNKGL